jgi:hypothetical protein
VTTRYTPEEPNEEEKKKKNGYTASTDVSITAEHTIDYRCDDEKKKLSWGAILVSLCS